MSSPEYQTYLDAQIAKTTRMGQLHTPRVSQLIQRWQLVQRVEGLRVLSVGCRNGHELDALTMVGCDVTGIDLVAQDPRIQEMDMHAPTFPDHTFDAVFSCHSLEHAWDVPQALTAWHRVTKPGGTWVIEVPIRFQPTAVDRWDAGSSLGLVKACRAHLRTVLYHGEVAVGHPVAQLIGIVR